jgi:hypothetical protein
VDTFTRVTLQLAEGAVLAMEPGRDKRAALGAISLLESTMAARDAGRAWGLVMDADLPQGVSCADSRVGVPCAHPLLCEADGWWKLPV